MPSAAARWTIAFQCDVQAEVTFLAATTRQSCLAKKEHFRYIYGLLSGMHFGLSILLLL
jgi:hypothetical protein